ncbi:MAG: glycosyltransferase [bacterium]|nr:glycosyltransferase [bacterium]
MQAKLNLLQKAVIRFGLVGVLATLIDFSTYFLLSYWQLASPTVANMVAFLFSLICTFPIHQRWTFAAESHSLRKQLIKYFVAAVGGVIISTTFIYITTAWYLWNAVLAKVAAVGLTFIWNFNINKRWTFKTKPIVQLSFNEDLDLAIVVPAYNEAQRITATIEAFIAYLNRHPWQYEIVIVNDGSKDDTGRVIAELARKHPTVRSLTLAKNSGKGKATQTGMLAASARLILLADADHSTPITELDKLMPLLDRDGFDIAIGSRYEEPDQMTTPPPLLRRIVSRLGNLFIQGILLPGIKDTQCGFKLFRNRPAKEIFSRLKIRRFGFDVEVLVIARHHRYQVAVVPVQWAHAEGSTVRQFSNTFNFFKEVMLITLNLITGRYS